MLVAFLMLWILWVALMNPNLLPLSLVLFILLAIALLLGIPAKWYNKQLVMAFLQIPGAILSILKATLHIGKARKQFIHTPHGETEETK